MNTAFTKSLTYKEYFKYLAPSIVSMIFLSFYTTVDGFFVSRYVGSNALAAINILIPLTCIFFGLAVMLASGSGAIVGIRNGSGKKREADEFFTFTVVLLVGIIVLLTAFEYIFLDTILEFLGSTKALLPYTRPYGLCLVAMTPAMMLKLFFEYFTRVDGFPKIAMIMSISGLVINLITDWFFIVVMDMGILGAGLGTAIAMYLSGFIGVWHFLSGKSHLKLVKPKVEIKTFFKACYNGSSEMMTELSTGVTTLLFNLALLKIAGENGVAAMSIITYFYYFFSSAYFGITVAAQPIISYNLGALCKWKLKEILRQSFTSLVVFSISITAISFIFAHPLVWFFSEDPAVMDIAVHGLRLFSATFLLIGINIFISGYFTAIGYGGLSALVSFCHTLIFVIVYLELLPIWFGTDGIWLTTPLAEATTGIIAISLYVVYKIHKEKNWDKYTKAHL